MIALSRADFIMRTVQNAIAVLDDLRMKDPVAAQPIYEALAAHLHSAAPMSLMVETGPVVLQAPAAAIERTLRDGGRYRLANEAGETVLQLVDFASSHAVATLTPTEVTTLRADLQAVAP